MADSLDARELRACSKRFLSSKVLRRSLSYERLSNGFARFKKDPNLGLFLEIERIDSFQLPFLAAIQLRRLERSKQKCSLSGKRMWPCLLVERLEGQQPRFLNDLPLKEEHFERGVWEWR